MFTPGEAEAIKKLTGKSYYIQINDVEIASLKEGSYEDILAWLVFLALIIIPAGGMALPAGLAALFFYLWWYIYDAPEYLMEFLQEETLYGLMYVYALIMSVYRTYKFDVFKVAH